MRLKNYHVLYKDCKDEGYSAYICRTNNKPGKKFRIITIDDLTEAGHISMLITGLRFCDFIEEFYISPRYHIVFNYESGELLAQKLNNPDFTDTERYDIIKKLIETIIIKNIPPEFTAGILTAHNVFIKSDKTIGFCYEIPIIGISEQEITIKFLNFIKEIMGNKASENITVWLQKLYMREFKNLCQVYFNMPKLEESKVIEETEPTVMKKITPVPAIIAAMLVPAAFTVFLLFVQGEIAENKEIKNITAIGLVEL